MIRKHTPGPWPWEYTGDGKRIIVGEGLVEGPNGYEVAEVYSDDCPQEVAEANARLIAAAPDLLAALQNLERVNDNLAAYRSQPVYEAMLRETPDELLALDGARRLARDAIAKATT